MTSKPIETTVQDLMIEAIDDDGDSHGSFEDVFYENDLLRNAFRSEPDDFVNSRDFSITGTHLGEDAFGAFEYDPTSSIAGSIDNQASFASNSAPVSPVKPKETINLLEPIDVSSLSHEELSTDVGAPMSEVFLDLKDQRMNTVEVSPLHLREENNIHFYSGNTASDMELPNFNRVSETLSNARSSSISSVDNFAGMQNNELSQNSPSGSYHNNQDNGAGGVDSMFQQFTLEQLEPEPIVHNQINQQQQNGGQMHMHQNHLQQSHQNQMQYSRHMPIQNVHQQSHHNPQYQPSQNFAANQQSFNQQNLQPGTMIEPSQHGAFNNNNFPQMQNTSFHGSNYQSTNNVVSHSSHGVPFSGISQRNHSQPLTNNTYHGAPFRHNDILGSSSHHGEFSRRSSISLKEETMVGNSAIHGRQANVAIPPEHHSPQKFFNRGFDVPQCNPTSMPPTNMTDVMEKLSVSMRRSAMSRSMVKHISGRTIGSQNSARGLVSGPGSSRGFGQNSGMMMSHHSNKNLMKQGSEHGSRTLPIRRMSNTVKHPIPGGSIHRHDSHRSLSHSNHGQITLQIDDRNVGTF